MKPRRVRTLIGYGAAAVLLALIAGVAGCVRVSNGTWYVRSAGTPEGWPELTPVGRVQVKAYPAHRAAVVASADIDEGGMDRMFMELFDHIRSNDVAMTAPVEMGFDDARTQTPRMSSMGFLYRTTATGRSGDAGAVRVVDREPQTFASVGVRGPYTIANFKKGFAVLAAWLDSTGTEAIGPPRYLGYNGPFVPRFMRYGEVQVAVAPGTTALPLDAQPAAGAAAVGGTSTE